LIRQVIVIFTIFEKNRFRLVWGQCPSKMQRARSGGFHGGSPWHTCSRQIRGHIAYAHSAKSREKATRRLRTPILNSEK